MNLKIFLLFLPIFLTENIRKINYVYEINLLTKGYGYQIILSTPEFQPDKVLINNILQEVNTIMYYIEKTESQITNFTIIWNNMPKCSQMFLNLDNIISIDLSKFDSSQLVDMSEMFSGCTELKFINFTNFDVSNVEKMDQLFYNCINLTSLDLSSFFTNSLISMESMFQNDESLILLDLRNFDTSSVTNMKNMFNNCKSLKYINLISFVEKENVVTENIFSSNINNLIYCIDPNKSPTIYSTLNSYNFENDCENDIFKEDNKSEINNCDDNNCQSEDISLESNDIISHKTDNEIIKSSSEFTFKESQEIISDKPSIENIEVKENQIEKLKESLINILDSVVSNTINGTKEDIIGEYNDITYQITTTENQKNNNYTNISTIHLGECEDKLKKIYGIDDNMSLIILKIDYNLPYLLIPLIGYEVYHPINKSQLDLNYCNDTLIKVDIPVTIDEDRIYKYDPNSDYYNDECYAYTTENGTDIILNDRKNEFNDNNLSLCENNCIYKGYDSNTKKALCECEIKTDIDAISQILEEGNILSNNLNSTETNKLNINTMKCVSLLFSKNGLLKNIGNYIVIFTVFLFIISIIIFYKCGYQIIQNQINNIIDLKIKMPNNIDLFELNKKTKKNFKKKQRIIKTNPNKKKRSKSNQFKKKRKVKFQNNITFSNSGLKNTNILINNKDNENIVVHKRKNLYVTEKNPNKINLMEYEMNSFSYEKALELDKRKFYQYYFSLIKTKVSFLLAFYPINDYNIKIIKICLFFLFFVIYLAVNTLFFNDSTIHHIYKDGGKYNFSYFLPQIIYSFIICYIITFVIKYISLSEKNLLELKKEKNHDKIYETANSIKNCLMIKYILFFIISFVFLLVFWYYLSSFCAVYKNTQIYLVINTSLSYIINILYICIFNIFPTIFRKISLKENNPTNIIFYKVSKIMQLI